MNTIIYHPDPSEMPKNFEFPKEYLDMIARGEDNYDEMGHWYFMCYYENEITKWINIFKKDYPYLQVVPFARASNSDEVACFDNSNPTQILCIKFENTPGWEVSGVWHTFNDWFLDVVELAEEGWDHVVKSMAEQEAKEKDTQTKKP